MMDLIPWAVFFLAVFYSVLTLGLPQLSEDFKRDVRAAWRGDWRSVIATYRQSQQPPSLRCDDAPAPRTDAPAPRTDAHPWRTLAGRPLVFLYGGMGSGKTTLAHALVAHALAEDESARVVIATPKMEPGHWWGLPIATIDRQCSYAAIDTALTALKREVEERQALAVDGQARHRLVVVIDDTPVIARKCQVALADLIDLVATIGRSLGVSLLLLSQSNRAQLTGFKGMHDVLLDAPCVELRHHRATVTDGDDTYALDTADVVAAAAVGVPSDRYWSGGALSPPAVVPEPVRTSTAPGTPDTCAVRPLDDEELVTELVRRGTSANVIAKVVGGAREAALARVRQARARLGIE